MIYDRPPKYAFINSYPFKNHSSCPGPCYIDFERRYCASCRNRVKRVLHHQFAVAKTKLMRRFATFKFPYPLEFVKKRNEAATLRYLGELMSLRSLHPAAYFPLEFEDWLPEEQRYRVNRYKIRKVIVFSSSDSE